MMNFFNQTPIKLSLVALLPIITSISGCTMNPQQGDNQLSPEQINQSVNQWNALQPDVKRLIAMEKELVELKGLLMKLSQEPLQESAIVVSAPLAPTNMMTEKDNASHVTQSLSTTSLTSSAAAPELNIKSKKIGASAIQIGAFGSKADLNLATKQFYQQFSALKAITFAFSEPVVLGKALFRLKIGPFKSFKSAIKQCESLKQAKVDCLPTKLKANAILVN
jgi:hypothetical protein